MFEQSIFEPTVPDWLTGLWQRLSIEEDGQRDESTLVFWLQTHSCFGDIRIPTNRPEIASFNAIDRSAAIALSRQAGFSGIARLQGDICQWERALDYQPFTGVPDIGRLYWRGDLLIEEGTEENYVEEWKRVATGPTAAMVCAADTQWHRSLVICGDYFIFTVDERPTLPSLDSLTSLVTNQASVDYTKVNFSEKLTTETASKTTLNSAPGPEVHQYLSCEISMGRCQGTTQPWQIEHSTLPWREGRSLWTHTKGRRSHFSIEPTANRVIQSDGSRLLQWTVYEWGKLAELLPG